MPQLDLTDNERAVLIATLRRLIDLEPEPSAQTLKLILDRLQPQKPQSLCMDRLRFASEVVVSEVADMYPAC